MREDLIPSRWIEVTMRNNESYRAHYNCLEQLEEAYKWFNEQPARVNQRDEDRVVELPLLDGSTMTTTIYSILFYIPTSKEQSGKAWELAEAFRKFKQSNAPEM
jgi:hypothetical protein